MNNINNTTFTKEAEEFLEDLHRRQIEPCLEQADYKDREEHFQAVVVRCRELAQFNRGGNIYADTVRQAIAEVWPEIDSPPVHG